MNGRSTRLLRSGWLTAGLSAILTLSILAEIKIRADWRARWAAGEKGWEVAYQANALANAIEQYCIDFPDSGPFENTKDWTERLGGNNPKGIRYLKVEKYSHDSSGKLLDPCGAPWIIDVQGSPDFQHLVTPEPAGEFHVRSASCSGIAFGNCKSPRYPRS